MGGGKGHGRAMADFFISLSGKDKAWGDWIAWQLDEAGYKIIYQHWHFQVGEDFLRHMEKAGREADRVLLVLSNHYFDSNFTQAELTQWLYRELAGGKGGLVPVVIGECDLKGSLLGPRAYVDLTGLDEEAARKTLLEGLRQRGKPLEPPLFPGAGEADVSRRSGRAAEARGHRPPPQRPGAAAEFPRRPG